MAIRKIVKIGDDCLRQECRKQEKLDLRLKILLKDLADTMYKAEGVGLAAPQVGVLRRVVVIDVGDQGDGLLELINPVSTMREGEQCGREGCLSLPGRQAVVTRPRKVTVQYQNRDGVHCEKTVEGLFARAVCHELDHLDGKLYIVCKGSLLVFAYGYSFLLRMLPPRSYSYTHVEPLSPALVSLRSFTRIS